MMISNRPARGPWLCIACAILATTAVCPRSPAEEAAFSFTYTTDLLPKGAMEIEQWETWRMTKFAGTYDELQNRTEFEYGLTSNLQLSLYLNYDWTHAFHNGPFAQTVPPEQFAQYSPDPDDHFRKFAFESVSAELIYRVLSPYTNPVGLAFYIEPVRGPSFKEVETKVILQKNFIDDRLTLAFNFTYAPEWRHVPLDDGHFSWQEETDVNFNFAASYRFAPSWSAGAEFLNEHEYNSYSFHHESNSGYYLGPTIHYGGKKFFVTAAFFRQMPWASRHSDTVDGALVGGMIYDNDFEKYRLRVKFARYF
jgi:hypothetical protein